MTAPQPQDVQSAGVVVLRPGRRVLLVHRPKYDDWSFPKGKLERGEHPVAAAVREVAEETGLHVRLGVGLPPQRYPVSRSRMKSVCYWTGRVVGDDDVSGYPPNEEIDAVEWLGADDARERLTYSRDRGTLTAGLDLRRRTHALVVLRHGQARSRRAWRGDDRLRPLLQTGAQQAQRLVPLLAAYDVTRVVTSSSTRCHQTVGPYADVAVAAAGPGVGGDQAPVDMVQTDLRLTEQDATPRRVGQVVEGLLDDARGTVLCTHRPVLPMVFEALGVRDPELEPGEMLVVHLRKGRVRGTERHLP